MKTLRELIDVIDRAETNEGIRSGLAGAALAATAAMTPAAAQDSAEVIRVAAPTLQQQIAQAIQAGEVPRGHQYRARTRNGWVVSVTVDGETYDIRDRIPVAGQRMIAAADQLRQRMQEQELAEGEPEDPIARIDSLFRNS